MTVGRGTTQLRANLLGSARAEADPLLDRAFITTPDYQAITETQAYNFVVGRRGTGKSAIYLRARKHFKSDPQVLLLTEVPSEHASLEFHRLLQPAKSYRLMRAAASLSWHGHLLLWVAEQLLQLRLSLPGQPQLEELQFYRHNHPSLFTMQASDRFVEVLRSATKLTDEAESLPKAVADTLRLNDLRGAVDSGLKKIDRRAVLLCDGLDEGWEPSAAACAALGGLSKALADFSDAHLPIHGTAFVRDNMFRALFAFDDDFSRHIEDSTLRLTWDDDSLLHLVTLRLRVALDLKDQENDIRVWNAFADGELKDRGGFTRCLENTLLRPRDILVLLNSAALTASRSGRSHITLDTLDRASSSISGARLSDLLKEYARVLPGLESLVSSFAGHPAVSRLASVLSRCEEVLKKLPMSGHSETDFPLLSSPDDAFHALFAVGFVGVRQREHSRYQFCHDGSGTGVDSLSGDTEVMVHPCYWKALDVRPAGLDPSGLAEVTDEEENIRLETATDVRVQAIGRYVQAFEHIALGREGSQKFEDWAYKILRILLSPRLENFELKPSPGAVSQRDIVATVATETGFWARVNRDYNTRQVVFEVKNYEDPSPDDFRQVLAYSSKEYGRFGILVTRSESDSLSASVKAGMKSLYHDHDRVILVISSSELLRWIGKFRRSNRFDYTEDQLKKKLDAHIRRVVAIRSRE